jgi:hypothetical protein
VLAFPNERVIPTTSGKDISYLSIVQAGEYYTSLAKFLLQASQRVDVNLTPDTEKLSIFNHLLQVSNGRRGFFKVVCAVKNVLEFLKCFYGKIYETSQPLFE